jgi:drug/metabolite transporter (DMT)-like permease
MGNWQILTIIAPVFFIAYQALSKLLPKTTSSYLVTAYASLTGAVVMLVLHLILSPSKSIMMSSRTLWLTLSIGTLIALGNFTIIKIFNVGASQSGFSSLFNPLYIVYGLIVGVVVWKDKLNLVQLGGVALAIAGIVVISVFKAV